MKKLIAFLATACLISTVSFADNANDVLHIIPGAKTTQSTHEDNTTTVQQNTVASENKKNSDNKKTN